jgi:hypothetical protein
MPSRKLVLLPTVVLLVNLHLVQGLHRPISQSFFDINLEYERSTLEAFDITHLLLANM